MFKATVGLAASAPCTPPASLARLLCEHTLPPAKPCSCFKIQLTGTPLTVQRPRICLTTQRGTRV